MKIRPPVLVGHEHVQAAAIERGVVLVAGGLRHHVQQADLRVLETGQTLFRFFDGRRGDVHPLIPAAEPGQENTRGALSAGKFDDAPVGKPVCLDPAVEGLRQSGIAGIMPPVIDPGGKCRLIPLLICQIIGFVHSAPPVFGSNRLS